jgi:hypothetical protein
VTVGEIVGSATCYAGSTVFCLPRADIGSLSETMKRYETFEDARSVAEEVLAGSIGPNVGCPLIASIAAKLSYPSALEPFVVLAHDQEGHDALGITAENCIDDIVHACRYLIASQT